MFEELIEAIGFAITNFKAPKLDERGRQLLIEYLESVRSKAVKMRAKGLLLLLVFGMAITGCKKHEDAPPPYTPHVAGTWSGTGTDNTVGAYNISVTLVQSGGSASGTFTTSSAYGTMSGPISIDINPGMGSNLVKATMSRTTFSGSIACAGTMTLARASNTTDTAMAFYYNVSDCNYPAETGGLNLIKTAGTN